MSTVRLDLLKKIEETGVQEYDKLPEDLKREIERAVDVNAIVKGIEAVKIELRDN